jgi:secondary thiamine-phosphate synthase enzyme
VQTTELTLDTGNRHIVDLTDAAAGFCRDRGDGLLNVFVPHATAGLALIELGAGSDDDLVGALARLLPREDAYYRHRHGSPGHGADHLLPAFVGPSLVIPVVGGRMAFGTWQRLALVDLNDDNPHRRVRFTFMAAGQGEG